MHRWECGRCTYVIEMYDKQLFDAVVDMHIHEHFRNQRPQTALMTQKPEEIQWTLADMQFLHACGIEVD